ncbi:MAG: hypothetical protein ACTSUE_08545 [Promethearchaeota archaeon]
MKKTTVRKIKHKDTAVKYYKSLQIVMIIGTAGFVGAAGYVAIDYIARPKVSTAHYHFNIQYRVGNHTAMYEVINSTLLPILEMYERHPKWRANIELQSLALEFMDTYHVEAANLIRKLVVETKQIELVMIQYSSALVLAYPYVDMYKSINHTQKVIEDFFGTYPEGGISRAVLLQEGQFMLGSARILEDFKDAEGKPLYDTFLVTKECLSYYNLPTQAPIYTHSFPGREQMYILPYAQVANEAGFIHSVLWFIDGELVVAGEDQCWTEDGYWEMTNDYFQELEEMTRNHERRLLDLERQGNRFLTLDDWIETLIAKKVSKPLLKYIPETNWQITGHRGPFTWMGWAKGNTPYTDGEVCSNNYKTHQVLLATEVLLNYSYFNATSINSSEYSQYYSRMTRAWLDLAEAQVTDTTGINPWVFEGEFAFIKTGYAIANATYVQSYVINETTELDTIINGGGSFQIIPGNLMDGFEVIAMNQSQFINFTEVSIATTVPLAIEIMNADSMNQTIMRLDDPWNSNIDNLTFHKINIHFPKTSLEEKWAYIKFIGDFEQISYSPSLMEIDHVSIRRGDYMPDTVDYYRDWEDKILPGNCEINLPLSNGLIYMASNNIAIVKNNSQSHISMRWSDDSVRFMQTEIKNENGETWEYFILSGVNISQAVEFAKVINTYRPITLEGD